MLFLYTLRPTDYQFWVCCCRYAATSAGRAEADAEAEEDEAVPKVEVVVVILKGRNSIQSQKAPLVLLQQGPDLIYLLGELW